MAFSYIDGAYSTAWTVSGSSVSRMVGARLYYEVTETPTTYKVEVYGQETLYHDNVGITISGRLNLTGTTETIGSKTYTYASGGTNHIGVYYTIINSKSYTWTKTKSSQAGSASMKAYRNNYESTHYSLATLPITIPPIDNYSISYNANGGTGTVASQTKWYNESITLNNGTSLSRRTYKLVGWNTAADGSGTHYDLGATYTGNAALTLYAEWELNAIEVDAKVDGTWLSGIARIKVNGSWILPHLGFVKVNGSWEQITKE